MPTNLQALILLVLFVAPGFLAFRAYWRDSPRYYREADLFEQTVISVIASITIHLLALPAFLLLFFTVGVRTYENLLGVSFDFGAFVALLFASSPDDLTGYTAREFIAYAGAPAVYSGLTLVGAWYGGRLWQQVRPSPLPLWSVFLTEVLATYSPSVKPQFRVRLLNGDEYNGAVRHFRWVGLKDVTYELVLEEVMYTRAGSPDVTQPKELQVLLLSRDILSLSSIGTSQDQKRSGDDRLSSQGSSS